MKGQINIFCLVVLSLSGALATYSQNAPKTETLKGYLIVSYMDTAYGSGCGLKITTNAYGEVFRDDTVRCGDGSFYKGLSSMFFVSEKNVDLNQIDNFNYQIQLQKNEQYVFLSTDTDILLQINGADSSILQNTDLVSGITQNQLTADDIYTQVETVNKQYKTKRSYNVLMKVSIKVIRLPNRKPNPEYKNPMGFGQYILVYDKTNSIKAVKVIKDPFN